MGRRALRPIDPQLDLSGHFLLAEELPRPWDQAALFGRRAPLEIEVGTGKGLFLERASSSAADRDFLGIEVARKYSRFAAARLAKRSLANARVVCGDATRLFAELFPAESAAAVHVYFPDPWWKKRHHKRRVMNESFVADIERILIPGGRLHFWTDVKDYYDLAVETLAKATRLAGPIDVAEQPAESPLDYRTHFERRCRLAGLPVWRSEFAKGLAI